MAVDNSSLITLPQITLGFMMLATMLTVVAGWIKMGERVTRIETHIEILLQKSLNRRTENNEKND